MNLREIVMENDTDKGSRVDQRQTKIHTVSVYVRHEINRHLILIVYISHHRQEIDDEKNEELYPQIQKNRIHLSPNKIEVMITVAL